MKDDENIILNFDSAAESCEHCYVPEDKLEETKFDLIIIGGGAAGFSVATMASESNLRIAMINDGLPIGGTCVNVGCVPSKILIEMGNKYYYSRSPPYESLQGKCVCTEQIDIKKTIAEKDQMINMFRNENYIKVAEQFTNVTQIKGRARFISPTEVEVNGKILQADKFIITTGSRPRIIPFKGLENVQYLTNREALNLSSLPKTMIVIGAGPIGLELAQMFLHFGSKVIVLEKATQVLPRIEPEIAHDLQGYLEDEGLEIHLGVDITEIKEKNGVKMVNALVNGNNVQFTGEELLIATGVTPNTDNLGLKHAGVNIDSHGFIIVNEEFKTTAEHIWAAGDVIGKMFLETISAKQGNLAGRNALENTHETMNYDAIPQAIFTMPQVATVGLTDAEFKERYDDCECKTIHLSEIPKALALKDTRGSIKMIVHPETNVIMGVHIVAPTAAALIHEATLAVKFKLTLEDIIDTVHVFPTMSEGIKRVAQAFDRDIKVMACCVI